MINKELIIANESLKELSEDQVNDIITLGKNAIKKAVGERTKEIYDEFDKDVSTYTGKPKTPGGKTYDDFKNLLIDMSQQIETYKAYKDEVDKLKTTNKELQKSLEDGKGAEAIQKQYNDLKAKLEAKELKFKTDLATKEEELSKQVKENSDLQFSVEVAKETGSLKFNNIYDEKVRNVYMKDAENKLRENYILDKDETGRTIWRNKESNEIVLNKEKGLNPATTADLLLPELAPILDTGKKGGGTGGKAPSGGSGNTFDISGAKSKTEAIEMMNEHVKNILLPKGEVVGSIAFQSELDKLTSENKDAMEALPLQ